MATEDKYAATRVQIRLLDVAVLFLALLTALAVWQQSNLAYIFEADHTPRSFAVSFEITNVRYTAIESLAAGTPVYVGTERGTVELGALLDAPAVLPRIKEVMGEEGMPSTNVLLPQNDPDRYVDVTGTFLCRGVLREGALVLGDVTLSVGSDVLVSASESNLQIRVLSISENR